MKIITIFTAIVLILACSSHEPGNCGKMPDGNRNSFVRIVSVIPNPNGKDDLKESFTIKNFGSSPISLKGWKILHSGKSQWNLDSAGELLPCHVITIYNLKTQSLNNSHDYLKLIDSDNIQIQSIEWNEVPEGKEIIPD